MNKNEISCNTIIDLMPIYKENSCSEETRLLVEEHLSGCKSCRSLSEAFYVSEPVKAELPNEAETFRKVGRKLKRSRFTKAMAVLMCFCVILFAAVNGAWYFLKYRPMKQMCKGMHQLGTGDFAAAPTDRKLAVYVDTDDDYFYAVRLPNYLNFTMGTVTVAPIGAMSIDESGANCYDSSGPILTIPYDVFGTDHYFVDCSSADSGEGFVFETDTGLSKPFVSIPGQEDAKINAILETHKDELSAMKKAAEDKWGSYIK
ncbi:MAG: zf-HC2 domain-containing protein [Ruminococcus sp.]|nr:zf-HC2 domain-containing protein [Ruminococcus sp.]